MTARKYTEASLREAVKQAKSYREVSKLLGFAKGASHINKIIDDMGLDTSHFEKPIKGVSKFADWIGQRFGMLTIIELIEPDRNATSQWQRKMYKFNCKCDCGKYRIYPCQYFKRGLSLSCGCDKQYYNCGNQSKKFTGYKGISGGYWTRATERANYKQIEFSISIEEAWEIYESQNGKCALSGLDIPFGKRIKDGNIASLDRKDSSLGYIKGNIQWVHKDINKMKNSYKQDYFISMCQLVGDYNREVKL